MVQTQVVTYSGSSYTYTNASGKNVRFIVSFGTWSGGPTDTLTVTVNGIVFSSLSNGEIVFGKNVSAAYVTTNINSGVALNDGFVSANGAFSLLNEVYLSNGQSLSINSSNPSKPVIFNGVVLTES